MSKAGITVLYNNLVLWYYPEETPIMPDVLVYLSLRFLISYVCS